MTDKASQRQDSKKGSWPKNTINEKFWNEMSHSKQTLSEGCLFAQRWQWKKRGCSVHIGLRVLQKHTNRGSSMMMHESVRESRAPNTDQPVWDQTALQLLHPSHRWGFPHTKFLIYIYLFHQDSLGIVASNKYIHACLTRHKHSVLHLQPASQIDI